MGIVSRLPKSNYLTKKITSDANWRLAGLVPKIRDIGSALLDDMRVGDSGEPDGSGTSAAQAASTDLRRLLEKLERLDFHPWDNDVERQAFVRSSRDYI